MRTENRSVKWNCAWLALLAFALVGHPSGFAAPVAARQGPGPADPPPSFRGTPAPITSPAVVEGKKAGIDVGDCAPDFQLEPIEAYDEFTKWLGPKAPKSFDDKVMLSDFVGKAPIILLFGSYT